jgi:TM2 domain-containing membrane protein YozV
MVAVATYVRKKDKITTVLLAFFLGGFGVHRFYLDQVGRGVFYLLFSWTPIPWIIAFIDFIVFAVMSRETFDWKFNSHIVYKQVYNRGNTYQRRQNSELNRLKAQVKEDGLDVQHRRIFRKVTTLRDEIMNKIKTSSGFESSIVRDIKPLLEKYVKQVKELIQRDRKLKEIIEKSPLHEVDKAIERMKQKSAETDNNMLKYEYQNAVSKHEKHKQTILEFIEQREMVGLRLKSTVMSLEQIKFDLVKLESLASEEQRKEFTRMFEEKSSDLSNYLDLLKETYETTTVN